MNKNGAGDTKNREEQISIFRALPETRETYAGSRQRPPNTTSRLYCAGTIQCDKFSYRYIGVLGMTSPSIRCKSCSDGSQLLLRGGNDAVRFETMFLRNTNKSHHTATLCFVVHHTLLSFVSLVKTQDHGFIDFL